PPRAEAIRRPGRISTTVRREEQGHVAARPAPATRTCEPFGPKLLAGRLQAPARQPQLPRPLGGAAHLIRDRPGAARAARRMAGELGGQAQQEAMEPIARPGAGKRRGELLLVELRGRRAERETACVEREGALEGRAQRLVRQARQLVGGWAASEVGRV